MQFSATGNRVIGESTNNGIMDDLTCVWTREMNQGARQYQVMTSPWPWIKKTQATKQKRNIWGREK